MADKNMTTEINITELLLQISSDVSAIKTDMANFKEAQKIEKETFAKEIADVEANCERKIDDLENRIMSKFNTMQSVQNTLVGEVDTLKHAEDKKDAQRWKTIMAFVGTSVGSMVLVKLPEIIRLIMVAVMANN